MILSVVHASFRNRVGENDSKRIKLISLQGFHIPSPVAGNDYITNGFPPFPEDEMGNAEQRIP